MPAGLPRKLTADAAAAALRGVRPRTALGRTPRGLGVELIAEVRRLDRRIAVVAEQITAAVAASGTILTELHGIGDLLAAKILTRTAGVGRFRSAAAFASCCGVAPLDVSSGGVRRHRLSRTGDRQLNSALHVMAITQIRHDTAGKAYYQRKSAEGKTRREALRCLIGGVSTPRSGSMSGRGSSVASGDGRVAAPRDGQFEYRHPRCAEAPRPA